MKKVSVIAVIVAIAIAGAGCTKKDVKANGQKRASMKFPVEVQAVEMAGVQYSVEAVGSVEAFEQVEVTARVTGAVDRVKFTEGSRVSAGQPLVEIDRDRYHLAVTAAEASLAQAAASLDEARAGLARRVSASERNPGLIRGEELDTWRTRVSTAEASLQQAKAALEQAKLNLRDAFVSAPVAGTIQTRTVQTGQYVQPGSVLATLVRRDPLLLRFQVTEQEAPSLKLGSPVKFTVAEANRDYHAKITHVAASASSSSRMVPVTAEVDDPRRAELRPGIFARVSVPVSGQRRSPVVPQTAIRPSERGFLAFVVEDGKAHERILTLGLRTPDGQVEVKEGIKEGDKLIIRGNEALRDGVEVEAKK
ncbi:MAG: efflux RND transporter periplasmic adaptor subunit [Acidobacteria bacterium]|nr:efflux RND transporter periplasmic adaptor subunit [Acidobacteriota bacterium]